MRSQKHAVAERKIARLEAENAKLQLICDAQKKFTALGDGAAGESGRRERREFLMMGVTFLAPRIGIVSACTDARSGSRNVLPQPYAPRRDDAASTANACSHNQ
jgi:hypothetical protein